MKPVLTQTVGIEMELWNKYHGIDIRKHWAYKNLSPALRWGLEEEFRRYGWSPVVIYLELDVRCYPGEDTIYYPNDRAYPGSPPYAEAELVKDGFYRTMRNALDVTYEGYWMLYSWYDHYRLWEMYDHLISKYIEWVEDNYNEIIDWPDEGEW